MIPGTCCDERTLDRGLLGVACLLTNNIPLSLANFVARNGNCLAWLPSGPVLTNQGGGMCSDVRIPFLPCPLLAMRSMAYTHAPPDRSYMPPILHPLHLLRARGRLPGTLVYFISRQEHARLQARYLWSFIFSIAVKTVIGIHEPYSRLILRCYAVLGIRKN